MNEATTVFKTISENASGGVLKQSLDRIDQTIRTEGRRGAVFATNPNAASVGYVLREMGVDIASDAIDRSRLQNAKSVEEASRLFGVRTRTIVLPENWWLSDHGNLVGYQTTSEQQETTGEETEPVALVSGTTGRYFVVRTETGAQEPVTEELAARIKPFAVEILPSLPHQLEKLTELAKFLVPVIRNELKWTAVIGALTGLIGALLPIATAFIIDTLIPGAQIDLLIQVGIGLGVAALITTSLSVVREYLMLRINGRSEVHLESAVWDHILKLPASKHREFSSGDLESRMAGIDALRGAIVSVVLSAALAAVFSIFYLVLLLQYDLRLAGVAILYVLILIAASLGIALYMRPHHRRMAELSGWLSGYVFQILQAVVKLRTAGAEERAMARWADKYADYSSISLKTQRITGRFNNIMAFYSTMGMVGLYAVAHYGSSSDLSAGVFIAFLAAFGGFQSAFQGLSSAFLSVLAVTPQWDRAKPLLEAERESSVDAGDPGELSGAYEVTNVSFGYEPGQLVLKDVNLKATQGEQIALVGPSGSGKSTLVRLMLALDVPEAGSITYDNQELQGLDLTRVRRQIGVVTQSGRISAGSIMDNVRGATNLSYEQCLAACHAAGLERDLETFPMGLHTPLTEGGATLSGGQRQRILIARALVGKPRILIFDEATSALDNRTQAIVTESLARLQITQVIVAHRLSTIAEVDRIYVMDKGEVIEHGTYEKLMERDGLFAELSRRQLVEPKEDH